MLRGQMWTARELEAMPTLHVGQFDDLKIEAPGLRVWLSRMTRADGAQHRCGVCIEVLRDGRWEVGQEYEGADVNN